MEIGGVREVSRLLGRSPQLVCMWAVRGTHGFPKPLAWLAATAVYDMATIKAWAAEHPELVRREP